MTNTLHEVFHLQKFRAQQLQTINCILSKKDVLLIAPTGKTMVPLHSIDNNSLDIYSIDFQVEARVCAINCQRLLAPDWPSLYPH